MGTDTEMRNGTQCLDAQWNPTSPEEKVDSGTENAAKSAQGSTEDATCNLEKEKAHFSGAKWNKRATAKKKCKDCLTTTGEPENAQLPESDGREGGPEEAAGSECGEVQEIAGADALEPGAK